MVSLLHRILSIMTPGIMHDIHFSVCLRTHLLHVPYIARDFWHLAGSNCPLPHQLKCLWKQKERKTHNNYGKKKSIIHLWQEFLLTKGSQVKREKLVAWLCFTSWNDVASSHWTKQESTLPAPFCPMAQRHKLLSQKTDPIWALLSASVLSSCPFSLPPPHHPPQPPCPQTPPC